MRYMVLCGWLCIVSGLAPAAPLYIGYLDIVRYEKKQTDTLGGANFVVKYNLSDRFDGQDCCKRENLRWLQLVKFTPNVSGFPAGDFIDPQPGQNIGGGFFGDDLPFYDITDDTGTFPTIQRGKGRFLGDGPFAVWELGNIDFLALTLLVCILEPEGAANMITLGGIQWGYSNDAVNKKTTLKPATYLTDTAALRQRFNDALDAQPKFKDWNLVEQAARCGPACVALPEPPSAWSMIGSFVLVWCSRRWVWRS